MSPAAAVVLVVMSQAAPAPSAPPRPLQASVERSLAERAAADGVERARPREKRCSHGALKGAAFGAVAGVVLMAVLPHDGGSSPDTWGGAVGPSEGAMAIFAGGLGAGLGAAIGAVACQ